MLGISLGEGRTLRIDQRLGRGLEVHFDTKGKAVAFRLTFATTWPIVHRLKTVRMPKGWGSQIDMLYEHDLVEFQNKLGYALHRATGTH
jgi:hypothetical protein